MDVSVIIVNYNTADYVCDAVNSILEKTSDVLLEIIVVDNDSAPPEKEKLRLLQPRGVHVIFLGSNRGFGAANNAGNLKAVGNFLFFLNPDTLLVNNAIDILLKAALKDSRMGCIGGNLRDHNGNLAFSFGNFPSVAQQFAEIGFHQFFRKYYKYHLAPAVVCQKSELFEVDYVTGADLMIRKSLFDELGGFDEDFFLYYEETDLCMRLNKRGYKCCIQPKAEIIHFESVTTNRERIEDDFNIQKYTIVEKSKYHYFRKSHGNITARVVKALMIVKLFSKFVFKGFHRNYIKSMGITIRS